MTIKTLTIAIALGVSTHALASTLPVSLDHFKTFQAHFTQTTTAPNGSERHSKGEIWILRPNHFRYAINTPNQQLYVSNGKQLWNYEQDLMQVIVQPLKHQLSQTPLLLLSGKTADISKLFTIKKLGVGRYQFTPKNPNSLISKVALDFKNKQPNRLTLTNPFGQLTSIQFSDVKLDQSLPSTLFEFKAPKGVDVLKA